MKNCILQKVMLQYFQLLNGSTAPIFKVVSTYSYLWINKLFAYFYNNNVKNLLKFEHSDHVFFCDKLSFKICSNFLHKITLTSNKRPEAYSMKLLVFDNLYCTALAVTLNCVLYKHLWPFKCITLDQGHH